MPKYSPETLTSDYHQNVDALNKMMHIDSSFDVVGRDLEFVGIKARLYYIDGFIKDMIVQKIITSLSRISKEEISQYTKAEAFANTFIPYNDVKTENRINVICTAILSGPQALLIEGFDKAVIINARSYPTRSITEPDSDRVLRGARDSFCETLILNTALIRRHIRDSRLIMQHHSIGTVSKTDVVLCFLSHRVDTEMVKKITMRLDSINVKSLSMSQESLTEALLPQRWFNPFPRVRYTERPDSSAAAICEGSAVIIVDGSPSVMLLPTSFFDFFQDTNDYYFAPIVGSYIRITRYIIYILTLMLIPIWYLLIKNPEYIPQWLDFIKIEAPNSVPVFFQLLVVELIIDCLKLASLNTPSSLGSSFSVVAALILGEFAVTARWFVPEVLLYMAFVAVANFSQPSFELGYALKLARILLIVLIETLNIIGFWAGVIIIALLIITTPTITGQSYLYPLIPFNFQKMLRLIVRQTIHDHNT